MKKKQTLEAFIAKRVLVVTDFSPLAQTALPLAKMAMGRGSLLKLLYVEPPIFTAKVVGPESVVRFYDTKATRRAITLALKHLKELTRRLDGHGTQETVVESAEVASAIAREARRWKADLVCLSTHGRGAFKRLLFGSVALKLMALYSGRVLLLRPKMGGRS